MPIIVIGITILLAQLFPFDKPLAILLRGVYNPIFGNHASMWFYLITLLTSYILILIIAIAFVNLSQLKSRLPKDIPGNKLTLVGIIIIALYIGLRLYAVMTSGNLGAFIAQMYMPLFTTPANILLIIGITKTLLAALPSIGNYSRKTAQKL